MARRRSQQLESSENLRRRRTYLLICSEQQQRGPGMAGGWSHWTPEGTFKIEPVILGGSWHYRLWFNKNDLISDLGVYSYASTAAESIGQGNHDQALGFAASKLGVPVLLKDWNGFACARKLALRSSIDRSKLRSGVSTQIVSMVSNPGGPGVLAWR